MFEKPSLIRRIIVSELVGFAVGLLGFLTLPWFWPDAPAMLRWGVLLWYTTLGTIIGVFGIISWRPLLTLSPPWWVRDPLIGGWMNFIMSLIAWDMLRALLVSMFGAESVLTSPIWFIVEGMLVGLLIGYVATKYGGKGKTTVANAGMDR